MIILEGIDGGGKTSLLKEVCGRFGITQRPRFSSADGPLPNLFDRVYQDLITIPTSECQVYDRHPLISDYVYAPALRGGLLPEFTWPSARSMRNLLAAQSLVVWCVPPKEVVSKSLLNRIDEGNHQHVHTRLDEIYDAYLMQRNFWPGDDVSYDYTDSNSRQAALRRIEQHITKWNMNR